MLSGDYRVLLGVIENVHPGILTYILMFGERSSENMNPIFGTYDLIGTRQG